MKPAYDVIAETIRQTKRIRLCLDQEPTRLRITSKAIEGQMEVAGPPDCLELYVHPRDWKAWNIHDPTCQKEPSSIAGIPVFIDQDALQELNKPTLSSEPALFIRVKDEGPGKQCIEVHDSFGNKLGELKGVSAVDYRLRYREHGMFTVTFRASPAYIESP